MVHETVPTGEGAHIAGLLLRLKEKLRRDHRAGPMPRDVHVKMHGLAKAQFIVHDGLAAELRVGLFREPRSYQAWIRFSNADGARKPDSARDVRGMAIKLMGVAGDKILDNEKSARTHDFILISTPVFPTRDVAEFDALAKAIIGSLFAKLVFFLTHWRVAWLLFKAMSRFSNPLGIRYFSTTPYLFGSRAVKYCATPRADSLGMSDEVAGADQLRLAMTRQLKEGDVVFDFCVQLQSDARAMPIEDPSRVWPEAVSPFRTVATIRVLQQDLDAHGQLEMGEQMSFTPWHALPEHRPLGGINRARRVVYEAISTFRHAHNKLPRKEPDGW